MKDITTMQQRERSHWKQWQNKADTLWGWQTPAGKIRAQRRSNLFVQLGRMTHESIVLEIGCGTGEFTALVAPHVHRLHASDLSSNLLEKARIRLAGQEPIITLAQEDAMNLSFSNNYFDAAFGCSILHHLHPAKALAELFRVLQPGGWIVFSEPNMLNPQIAAQKNIPLLKRYAGDSPDETAFFPWQMRTVLQTAGFTNETIEPFDWLHPLTPPILIPIVQQVGNTLEHIPVVRFFCGSLIMAAQKPR
jgi:ubiquinone/menaquinone biosynthesis C-methylase UbiE